MNRMFLIAGLLFWAIVSNAQVNENETKQKNCKSSSDSTLVQKTKKPWAWLQDVYLTPYFTSSMGLAFTSPNEEFISRWGEGSVCYNIAFQEHIEYLPKDKKVGAFLGFGGFREVVMLKELLVHNGSSYTFEEVFGLSQAKTVANNASITLGGRYNFWQPKKYKGDVAYIKLGLDLIAMHAPIIAYTINANKTNLSQALLNYHPFQIGFTFAIGIGTREHNQIMPGIELVFKGNLSGFFKTSAGVQVNPFSIGVSIPIFRL